MDNNEVVITKMLQDNPKYRDDDKQLMFDFWTIEQHWDLSRDYFVKFCLSAETITRIRRKIQEDKCWLRGDKYEQRDFLSKVYQDKYKQE
jgi:hypothetical protein